MSELSPQWSQRSYSRSGGMYKGIKRFSADYAKWLLGVSIALFGTASFMMYRIRQDPATLEQSSFNTFIKGDWGKTVTWFIFILAVVLAVMSFMGFYQ
jgi:hypothetical protein